MIDALRKCLSINAIMNHLMLRFIRKYIVLKQPTFLFDFVFIKNTSKSLIKIER